ncbi:MAG: redox-sensing transcriptional repressor Rex [Sedimentisphaerales bacterium]|nr:redox-sensing transcriptional repressor Rex [Sedimentisphaerales bacterium]
MPEKPIQMNPHPSEKTIARLSLYRRCLRELAQGGSHHTYSHELAKLAGVTAAQVRRDLMVVGYDGSPRRGYEVKGLYQSIGQFLDGAIEQKAVLIGVGNLGRAILAYFHGKTPNLEIVAAFDNDPQKIDRVVMSCRCFSMTCIEEIIARERVQTAIITVPADEAQRVTDVVIQAGVQGILNFAPVRLQVPAGVFVEQMDMAVALQKVAYFSRQRQ